MANLKDEVCSDGAGKASPMKADLKLEAVVIPVSDVDRANKFYGSLGWRLDADFAFDNGFRADEAAKHAVLHVEGAVERTQEQRLARKWR